MSDENDATIDEEEEEQESGEENEEPHPDADKTLLLKELAESPETPLEQIADEMGLPFATCEKIVNEFVETMVETAREADFPERLRSVYNRFVEKPRNKLNHKNMVVLLGLIDRFYQKMIREKADARERQKLQKQMVRLKVPGVQEPQAQQVQQQPEPIHQQVVYRDSYVPNNPQYQAQGQPPPQGQPQPQQGYPIPPPIQQQQPQGYSTGELPYEDEESLMKYLLETNPHTMKEAWKIPNFMLMFRRMKHQLLEGGGYKLLAFLKGTFGPVGGETVFMMYNDTSSQVSHDPSSLYKLTGVGEYDPVRSMAGMIPNMNPQLRAMFENQGQFSSSSSPNPAPGNNPINAQEDKFYKSMDIMAKSISMGMMQRMAEANMPGGAMGGTGGGGVAGGGQFRLEDYDIFEKYDNEGRVVGRQLVRKQMPFMNTGYGIPAGNPFAPPQQQDGGKDRNIELIMEFMKMTMNSAEADRRLLMERLIKGDTGGINEVVGTILKQAVGAMGMQTDPLQGINKALELADTVNKIKGPPPQKSMEERKIEFDYMALTRQMEAEKVEKEREFTRQQAESASADQRMDTVIKEISSAVKEVAGPVIQTLSSTFGQGLAGKMPSMQPGMGMPPNMQRPPERVVIREVPVQAPPQQQQPTQFEPPQPYTQEQIAAMQAEQQRRAQEAQKQQEQQQDNRPIEEQLQDYSDEEVEELAHRAQAELMQLERTGHKILAERARRKNRGGVSTTATAVPERKYVSPIVGDIAQHEAMQRQQEYEQQMQQQQQQQYDEPEEPKVNPFADEPSPETRPSAVDLSNTYDDEDVQESLRHQGQLPPESEEPSQDISNIGIPSTSVRDVGRAPIEEEQQEPEEPVIDEVNMEDIDASSEAEIDSD